MSMMNKYLITFERQEITWVQKIIRAENLDEAKKWAEKNKYSQSYDDYDELNLIPESNYTFEIQEMGKNKSLLPNKNQEKTCL